MGELSAAFGLLTGTSCRCCVKVISGEKKTNEIPVTTYCQNSDVPVGPVHPLEHNTDFNVLFQAPTQSWFFGNDLAGRAAKGEEYDNTTKGWEKKYAATVV